MEAIIDLTNMLSMSEGQKIFKPLFHEVTHKEGNITRYIQFIYFHADLHTALHYA